VATTGAQMSAAYTAAVQLVDGQVLPNQFRHDQLNRGIVWDLIGKTECLHAPDLGEDRYTQRVTITLNDGTVLSETLDNPRSVSPGLSNQEILEKWRRLTQGIMDEGTRDRIERLVLEMETLEDVRVLDDLMSTSVSNPLLS
jgi:aconitate decarboxylase